MAPDGLVEAQAALAERAALLERRVMQAYRALASRFAASEAGIRFAELGEGEAQHFALLNLAGDFVRMASGPGAGFTESDVSLAEAEPLVAAIEAAAAPQPGADPAAALPVAVEVTVRFEAHELPRVAAQIDALPEPARARTRAAFGQTLPSHYAALEALARLVSRDDLTAAARALAARAAAR
jgi:hypothetical protein